MDKQPLLQNPSGSASAPPEDVIVEMDEKQLQAFDAENPSNFKYSAPPPSFSPAAPSSPSQAPVIQENIIDSVNFTEKEARICLEQWVKGTWYKRRGVSEDLIISNFNPSNAYVILLETFVESRRLVPDHRPYRGGAVDGPQNGLPPSTWEIRVPPPRLFNAHKQSMTLPHTEEVRTCFRCQGRARIICPRCIGRGTNACSTCSGSGHVKQSRQHRDAHGHLRTEWYDVTCGHCHGSGRLRCGQCTGDGRITCPTCQGFRNLVYFTRLDIIFENLQTNSVVKASHDKQLSALLPNSRLMEGDGPIVLAEENLKLLPADEMNVPRINLNVNHAVNVLLNAPVDQLKLLHRQRLTVRGLPVYEVIYNLKGDNEYKKFWVYGMNRQIFAPDYPTSKSRVFLTILLILLVLAGIGVGLYFGVFRH